VQNQPEGATSHVSVQRLRNAAALVDMSHFAWMVRYLTGARVPLFDVVYEFVDDEIIEVVSADDLHEARNTGEFYHPITGELVCDYESKVVVYFSVSKAAAAIRSKKR
jgi:hypothetical protein